jgi:mRNA-degrading endonuclease toxin of MazEF toxin-antitoxin module
LPEPETALEAQPQLPRLQNNDGYTLISGIERGMIFWGAVQLEEHRDAEHYHPESDPCPWVILSSDHIHRRSSLCFAAPLSSRTEKADGSYFRQFRIRILNNLLTHYRLGTGSEKPLTGDSIVLTEQARAFAHDRLLGNPIAKVNKQGLYAIEAGLKFVQELQ